MQYSLPTKEVFMATSAHCHQPAHPEPKTERLEPERMVLLGADREAFLDAVQNPPEPAEKLVAALRRHRAVVG